MKRTLQEDNQVAASILAQSRKPNPNDVVLMCGGQGGTVSSPFQREVVESQQFLRTIGLMESDDRGFNKSENPPKEDDNVDLQTKVNSDEVDVIQGKTESKKIRAKILESIKKMMKSSKKLSESKTSRQQRKLAYFMSERFVPVLASTLVEWDAIEPDMGMTPPEAPAMDAVVDMEPKVDEVPELEDDAAEKIQSVIDALDTLADKVTEPEVKDEIQDHIDSLKDVVGDIEGEEGKEDSEGDEPESEEKPEEKPEFPTESKKIPAKKR
jgi:hypothetical protein